MPFLRLKHDPNHAFPQSSQRALKKILPTPPLIFKIENKEGNTFPLSNTPGGNDHEGLTSIQYNLNCP